MNFESMSHFKKRSVVLSSADWRSQESEHDCDIDHKKHVTSGSLVDPKKLLEHQEIIEALMIAIKPNLLHYYFKKYTNEMIKMYFNKIRRENFEAEESEHIHTKL